MESRAKWPPCREPFRKKELPIYVQTRRARRDRDGAAAALPENHSTALNSSAFGLGLRRAPRNQFNDECVSDCRGPVARRLRVQPHREPRKRSCRVLQRVLQPKPRGSVPGRVRVPGETGRPGPEVVAQLVGWILGEASRNSVIRYSRIANTCATGSTGNVCERGSRMPRISRGNAGISA